MNHLHISRRGFSLLELSIALVVIALLVGSILVGKELIHAAELRSVPNDINKFSAATIVFKTKYQYLPGDFPTATDVWGTKANCTTTTPTTLTCNGDGNKRIQLSACGTNENGLFWQHLANAELIEGVYSGYDKSWSDNSVLGTNIPKSKISGAGYRIDYNTLGWDALPARHLFYFTTLPNSTITTDAFFCGLPGGSISRFGAAITPVEAFSIDTKMDDGNPAYGKVRIPNQTEYIGICFPGPCTPRSISVIMGCITTGDASTAQYNLSNANIACPLVFNTGF